MLLAVCGGKQPGNVEHLENRTVATIAQVPSKASLCAVKGSAGFPLGLENLEKWEGIFQSGKSQGILNRLEKSGKTTQNTGKLR